MWKKIAEELRATFFYLCSELECCNKIHELRSKYEKIKNKYITNEEAALFLDEAKKAFETSETLGKQQI